MVNNQEPTSALEKVLLRALAAGLATPLEGARALAQLDASRLTFPAEEDHYDGLIDDSHRQASETRWAESPKEEVELVEWMTNAVSQAPWAREARFLPVSPHEPVQVLVRITDEDGYTTRLGIAYCQDDDNQQEFDENFQL